ncbi:polysaccharide lyase-domain-containing protein [Roridomyces roridus]|uniref:Polysaccharide lyase-domain-containing protein n=1 Tax=Roridomyces roridus TaxID=1738132 RepID=A0AAD7BBJ7_9AGAR|nr:polysaccharide lyase-domain-containing protein [Roridomyces roridus]
MLTPHTLLLCIITAQMAGATQTFANRGTTSGWDLVVHEHQGNVSNVFYGTSGTSIKATQTYDPAYSGHYHQGDTGFYGFAFRLQSDWQFAPAQTYNLAQFIADFSDTGCADFIPTTMVWIDGNQLATRLVTGSTCQHLTIPFNNLATVSAGVWHKVEIQAAWQNSATGFFKLWFDGVKVLEQLNVATTIGDGREFQLNLGLYANGWENDKGMEGTQPLRQVWIDQVGIGSVFADADPARWS